MKIVYLQHEYTHIKSAHCVGMNFLADCIWSFENIAIVHELVNERPGFLGL